MLKVTEKNVYYKLVLELNFAPIIGLGEPSCVSKKTEIEKNILKIVHKVTCQDYPMKKFDQKLNEDLIVVTSCD